jgi:hypothetical protein
MAGEGARAAGTATSTIFAVAASMNAIPIAGQVASAFLAVGGGLLAAFGGRRRAKREAAAERRRQFANSRMQEAGPQAPGQGSTVGGESYPQQLPGVQPVAQPQSPTFQGYNDPGQHATVQPQRLGRV